jgi:hypothetical protein
MSTIITIASGDSITNSRADLNTNFVNLNFDKIETSYLDTDTAMAANSDVKIPSQKAVKTYIDTLGGANASETVRGIVEEATDAEVTAGTATGATGAKLFVTPAKLATRVTSIASKVAINTTEVSVSNGGGGTEQTLFTVSIPANTLSTNNGVRFYVYLSNLGLFSSSTTVIFKVYYGSTAIATATITDDTTVVGMKGELSGYIIADGSTSAQKGMIKLVATNNGTENAADAAVNIIKAMAWGDGSATEVSTGALNLVVTAEFNGNNAADDLTAEFIIVEKIVNV